MMSIMKENHGDIYFEMLGALVADGMDIQTAIYECWNKLETNSTNKHIESHKL